MSDFHMPEPGSLRKISNYAQPDAIFPDTDVVKDPGAPETTMPPVGVANGWHPRTDVVETPDHYELRIDTPGVTAEELKVTLSGGVLTVFVPREEKVLGEGEILHRAERDYGNAFLSFEAPADAARSFEVEMANGITTIRISRVSSVEADADAPDLAGDISNAKNLPKEPKEIIKKVDPV